MPLNRQSVSRGPRGQVPRRFSVEVGTVTPDKTPVSVEDYLAITGDFSSKDDQVLVRLKYLESLCRYVIREELRKKHDKQY
jgi:hypothetical protein